MDTNNSFFPLIGEGFEKALLKTAKFFNLAIKMESGEIELNPILKKDAIYHSRKFKILLTQSVYALLIGVIFTVYYASMDEFITSYRDNIGQTIFWIIASLQFALAYFGPIRFATDGIAGERDRQTFESLYLTLLTPKHIFAGKFFSAVGSLILMIICSFPFIALSIVMGGVSPIEIFSAMGIILVLVSLSGIIGLSCSILFKTSKKSQSMAGLFLLLFPWLLFLLSVSISTFYKSGNAGGYISLGVMIGYYLLSTIVLYVLAIKKLKRAE